MTIKEKIKNYDHLYEFLRRDLIYSKESYHNLIGFCTIIDYRLRLEIEDCPELMKYKPSEKTIKKYDGYWFSRDPFGRSAKKRIKIVEEILTELNQQLNENNKAI